jgi:hypothetical protein
MRATNAFFRAAGVALLLGALALAGCGPRVKFAPVDGTVKINGRPAPNISVQFLPDALKGGKGPTSFGTTGADGKFRLKTSDGQEGAVVGPHRVVLADLDEERAPQGKQPSKAPRLSARYSLPTSTLAVDVKEGGGPIVLEAKGP